MYIHNTILACITLYVYIYIYIYIQIVFFVRNVIYVQDLGKKQMNSIHFKMTLLDEFTSLEVEGSREAVMLARYPNILRKGMLFKWKRNARRQRWHLSPEEISKQHKEIPNWLRESLGLQKRRKLSADTVPLEVLHKFDNALYSRCCALQAEQGVNELLTSRSMITLMTRIVARYNSNISKHNIEITRQNKELLLAFKNGYVSAEDALQGKKKLLKKVLYMCIYIYI